VNRRAVLAAVAFAMLALGVRSVFTVGDLPADTPVPTVTAYPVPPSELETP
jgi:hypothetical protein